MGLVTGVLFTVYGMEAYNLGLVTGVLFLYMGWRLTTWGL